LAYSDTTNFEAWMQENGPNGRYEALALRDALDEADVQSGPYHQERGEERVDGWGTLIVTREGTELRLCLRSKEAWTAFSEMYDREYEPKDRRWEEVREDLRLANARS
jgi:hypothetical protein